MVELRLLGPPAVGSFAAGEADTLLARPKLLALLAYLCAPEPGAFHQRERVVGLFWPELPQDRANAALRNALYHLKRRLGGADAIVRRGDAAVGIAPDIVRSDTVAFEAALARGDHDAAVALYRGDYLEGIRVSEADEFERWLDGERRRHRERAAEAMWALADRAREDGDGEGAARMARRAAALAPGDEGAARRLMTMLDAVGDRRGALAVFDALAQELREEWEADPSPETDELAARIRTRSDADEQFVGTLASGPLPATPHRVRRGTAGWAAAAAVLAFSGVGWLVAVGPDRRAPDASATVAVFPFDTSGIPDSLSYLRQTVTSDLVGRFARVRGVRMLDASTLGLLGGAADEERMESIGVSSTVHGELTFGADSLEIRARVLEARTNRELWSESVTVHATEFLPALDDLSRGIGLATARLSDEELVRVGTGETTNPLAYQYFHYARWRFNYERSRWVGPPSQGGPAEMPARFAQLLDMVRRAIELDSTYAMAYGGLANLYKSYWEWLGPAYLDSALTLATKAAEIAPENSAVSHVWALIYAARGAYGEALTAYGRTLDADPYYQAAMFNLAGLHARMGAFDETVLLEDRRRTLMAPEQRWRSTYQRLGRYRLSLGEWERAVQDLETVLDFLPEHGGMWTSVAEARLILGDTAGAIAAIDRAQELEPGAVPILHSVAMLAMATGDTLSAVEQFERVVALASLDTLAIVPGVNPMHLYDTNDQLVSTNLGYAYLAAGRTAEAMRALGLSVAIDRKLLDMEHESFAPRYDLARVAALRGEADEAVAWLEEAYDHGWRLIHHLWMGRGDPAFTGLAGDARFEALMQAVEEDLVAQRSRVAHILAR